MCAGIYFINSVHFNLGNNMLSFEFEPPKETEPCSCCGGRTTTLTRFIYKDGDAYAVYYVRYSDNHPERTVLATVSLGEWGENATPEQRVAFALRFRSASEQYEVEVLDAARSPWRDAKIIGRTLDRAEALNHPLLPEVFHITDPMVVEGKLPKAYLDGNY
jgi:hypothetical protein